MARRRLGGTARTCPRCNRQNGILTRAADGRFLCAECCAEVATMPSSVLVREPPALMDSDDAPSSASMPRCPLHPGSELIRTRMRDGSTQWTCSERNHDIENNWALCLPECKDNHGDTSLVDLFDDGRFECRNPQCPLVQQRRRAVTEVVERKSEFCLACMDTEPAMESKCPNGHISYCAECLPHLNPRQCGQCRMPIARAISPPPRRPESPPRPPARRITSLCPDCRRVLSLHNNGYWECTNAACAFGRMNPRIFVGICADCGGRTTCFSAVAGVLPYCTNPNCTAPLLDAPPPAVPPPVSAAPPSSNCRRCGARTSSVTSIGALGETGCPSCISPGQPGAVISVSDNTYRCRQCGRVGPLPPDGTRGPLCTSCPLPPPISIREPVPSGSPPVFVAPPLSDILPGPIMMNCSRCGTYGSLTAVGSRGPWLCASCYSSFFPRAARRLDFGSSPPTAEQVEEEEEDQAAAMVRLLGPQRRRPREQQPPTEEDKKELESKQEEEEEPAPQRRRLRHLWLYFGTEPRGVRPARGFVDGDIIISMRESPSPMTEMNGTSIMLYRLPRQQLPVLYRFALHDDETRDNNNNSSGWYMDFELDESPDANAFIDSENVSILFRNNRIRFTNHAFTELFRLLMDMVQSQRRIRQVERDLGFTPSS